MFFKNLREDVADVFGELRKLRGEVSNLSSNVLHFSHIAKEAADNVRSLRAEQELIKQYLGIKKVRTAPETKMVKKESNDA